MTTVPALTPAQRAEALERARAVRTLRRAFKDDVTRGRYGWRAAVAVARQDEALVGIRVGDLLQCFPGIGAQRAEHLMDAAGVARSRRLRGLGVRQVDALAALLGEL